MQKSPDGCPGFFAPASETKDGGESLKTGRFHEQAAIILHIVFELSVSTIIEK
jgi:hypothetical protein